MSETFRFRTAGTEEMLALHPQTAQALGIEKKRMVSLRFGGMQAAVSVVQRRELPERELLLGVPTAEALHLPLYPAYELRAQGNEVNIGPFIGLLMSPRDRRYTPARLAKSRIYLSRYAELHGAVVLFALDKVDAGERLVEGFCYHPGTQRFERGTFPLPAAVYRTVGLSGRWKSYFHSLLGSRLFNMPYFGKWKMAQWFQKDPALAPYLPETFLYHSPQDVLDALKKYPKVYLKPVTGLAGHGIVQVTHKGEQLRFRTRDKSGNHAETLENEARAADYMRRRFAQGRFLVQQGLDLIRYRDGVVDFRCIMQKNGTGKWECRAVIGRRGEPESVVSNIRSGGHAFLLTGYVQRMLPLPRAQTASLREGIASFALKVCAALDEYGPSCGTLGVDVGVDTDGKLWLIEINNRDPDPSIALNVGEHDLYVSLKAGPLFYAKFLAGF